MNPLDILVSEYRNQPELALFRILAMVVIILLANKFAGYAKMRKGKTLGRSLRYLSYSFYILAHIPLIHFLSVLPLFPWDLAGEIVFILFGITALYSSKYLAETIKLMDHIR